MKKGGGRAISNISNFHFLHFDGFKSNFSFKSWCYLFLQDNPVGTGTGKYNDHQLFEAKLNHASLVPIIGLMKADDFLGDKSYSKYDLFSFKLYYFNFLLTNMMSIYKKSKNVFINN